VEAITGRPRALKDELMVDISTLNIREIIILNDSHMNIGLIIYMSNDRNLTAAYKYTITLFLFR
jgi:hypothetical protein